MAAQSDDVPEHILVTSEEQHSLIAETVLKVQGVAH
jgi:hypothetical protein